MGRSRKKIPFQSLATDEETVAAALGMSVNSLDTRYLRGMLAGLQNTESPLKDAIERIVTHWQAERDLGRLQKQLNDFYLDADMTIFKSSEKIDYDTERFLIEDLQEVLFRLI